MGFINHNSEINNTDIELLRNLYVKALQNADSNDFLLNSLEKNTAKNSLLLAYQGACEGLKAKYVMNPYKKMTYLRKSQESLTKAISQEPNNIEIRFLRFSIHHNLPDFLKNNNYLEEDRLVIVKNIHTEISKKIAKETLQMIVDFLVNSKRCKKEEIIILKMAVE